MIKNLYSRLEISFCDITIPLMSESYLVQTCIRKAAPLLKGKNLMKKLRITGLAILIVIFLISSIQVSRALIVRLRSTPFPSSANTLNTLDKPTLKLPNGQRIILLVNVDDLTARHPVLETVFLALVTPGNASLSFLSVYPSLSEELGREDKQLAQTFEVIVKDEKPSLASAFLRHLEQRKIWWSAYIVLDRTAFGLLLDGLEEAKLNSNRLSGSVPTGQLIVSSLPPIGENTSLTVSSHIDLLKEICWRTTQLDEDFTPVFINSLPGRLGEHTFSDLAGNPALEGVNISDLPAGGYGCDFPTLSVQANLTK